MKGKKFSMFMVGLVAAMVICAGSAAVQAEVTFEWVTVGNPGNPADPLNEADIPGIGSVSYVYRIAKHEVTNDQYAEFLNAVAATDTNDLYSPSMGSDARGGITRSGSSGSFTYAVKANMGNKPVNYVSFFDAMRFVNWLHNGQPSCAQDASITEDGVYTISDGVSETRSGNAQYFIPTENEWYKAAYHQPAGDGGDSDDYWLYPTASNSIPTFATANTSGDINNPGANVANYDRGADWNGQNGNVTTVGSAGPLSESYHGTADQGGNVWEWNETAIGSSFRVVRGGSWGNTDNILRSSLQGGNVPAGEGGRVGFRVASPVSQAPVSFDWVTVGIPGNAEDPLNSGDIPGIGSVAYAYRIAKHEVTNDQYVQFLNAVAATDTNGLYNPNMGSDARGGITQSGSSGSFTYAVKADMGNKPVNYVSFVDAMRFVNWLHNGQPTGGQDASTTEDGVYTISDGLSEIRAGDAQFFIPTENEWYKAAYHQPSGQGGDLDNYWLFPTGSNGVPMVATADATGDISNSGANVVNYLLGADWNGQNGNVTTVGSAGPLSESFYGTSDQGGNVWEWTETVIGFHRVFRGGSWGGIEIGLQSSTQVGDEPVSGSSVGVGFRVASPLLSDLDGDGDVDLIDFGLFQNELTGPGPQ